MGVNYNPRVVTDGLVLALDAGNPKSYNYNLVTYSQDFQNAAYTKSAGLITATGVLAPDGTLTATTMTDDDAGNYDNFSRSFSILNDSTSYNISICIRKTTGATSTRTGFNVSITGGTTKSYNIRFNADTGVAAGGDSNLVTSENNNFWRLSFTVSNNSTGNTSLNISYFPATGIYDGGDVNTATGSHTVWGFQVTRGAALLPYRINVTDSYTTWTDLSGNGNHCTLYNSPSFSLNNGGYISLDGVDDFIRTTNTLNLTNTNAVTIQHLLKVRSYGTSVKILHELTTDFNSNVDGFVTSFSDNSAAQNFDVIAGVKGNVGYNLSCYSKTTLNNLGWHAHCIVHDKGRVSPENLVYSDGNLGPEIAHPIAGHGAENTNNFANSYFYIGARAGSAYFSPIDLAACYVYNRVLSAAEIQQNFNAIRGRFGI